MALEDMGQAGAAFLGGGGEMGALMRGHDWSSTPLGEPQDWPQPLRTAVRLMLNTGHPMYIWWGPDLLCFYNDAYRRSIGTERHPGSLGRPAREVWDEIWDIIGPQIEQVMAGRGATWHEDHLVPITRDGRREDVYWTYSYSPIDDDTAPNGVGGVLVVCSETTEKVEAEQRLAAQVERQQRLFRKAPGFICILRGPDHVFEFANEAYCRLVGDRELIGRSVREAFPEIADQGFFEVLDQVYVTGERYVAEHVSVLLKRGPGAASERILDFIYEPMIDEKGAVEGIFCEGYDVTDRLGAENALRESEARFREQFENANDFIFTADLEMRITSCNPAVASALGLVPEALIGRSIAEFVSPETFDQNKAKLSEKLAGETDTTRYEVEVLGGDGERMTWEINSRLTRDASGAPTGLHAIGRDVSQRRRAEDALRDSQERYRSLFETMDEGFCIIEFLDGPHGPLSDYVHVEANPAYVRHAGIPDVVGQKVREMVPDEAGGWVELYRGVLVTGDPIRFERELVATGRHLELAAFRVGPVERRQVAVLFQDVTARKRAEEELRESEARLRALADHLPGGMVYQLSTGTDGSDRRFVYVSQSHQQLTGISAEAVLQDPTIPYELIHSEDREALAAAEAEAIRKRALFDVEARFRRADGELRWSRIISAPREQPDGSLIWDGIQIDITDQKTNEAELRDREAQLRLVTEALPVLISYIDADCRYRFANKAYESWFEIGRDQVIGRSMLEVLGEKAFEQVRPAVEGALRGERQAFERELPYRYGVPRHVHVDYVPNRLGGQVVGFYALVNDVTDAKRIEQALRDSEARLLELNETLERRVEARTAELLQAQEQLRQSQKLEAMGQLTGGVAHDFNNLLTPIIGVLDMLKRRGLGGEREQRLIDGGLQSAERAKTLVHRLLAFARRQPLQPGPVDLAMLVEDMAELIASTSGPQIKLVIDVPDGLPAAEADRNQLEMAVLNLSVNARDAMPNGGRLTISAASETVGPGHRSQLRGGEYLRLSVADTGEGMDEATLERAIEPFFSTKGIGKGTGLGLSMVHGLAAQLGGAFAISSKPGLGTCVDLWLPRSDRTADASSLETGHSATRQGRGTALLVDDEDLVRASTADMLSELGFEVIEAGSAAEALAKLDGGLQVDILITDHMMPGMNGVDLAREVRDRMPGKPVLIVSGYAETDSIAPDLPRITKPFRHTDLAARLSNLAAADDIEG